MVGKLSQNLLKNTHILGDYKKLLGALESTAARRKHQILNALGNQILKLQKQVFVNWSQRDGFYNFNESNGFLETKYLPSNTLILTNSKPLYQILKPENSDETFNRHLSFPFPNEETFKFFTKEGNNNPLSTMYQRAKDLFKEEPFWGFYPPKQKDVTKSMKCKSDNKEFETILKDDSFDEPIFLLLINTRTQTPVESEVLFDSETKGHFNYLDVDDPNNLFFTKTLLSKLDTFITSSKLLTSYFGKLEVKNKQSILDPLQSIAPFVVGFKDDHQHQPPLANVDIFFNAVNENAFQMYLTPNTNAVTEWVSSHFLKEEIYPPSQNKSLNEGLIEILPNIKPFPLNPHRNRFEQPFILSATNFGSLNYLDLSTEKNSFMGDTQGAKSVVAILNYTSSKGRVFIYDSTSIFEFTGFFLARDQAAADISIDGNDSNK